MKSYREAAVSAARESVLLSMITVAVALGLLVVVGASFTDSLGLILLVEGAALLAVGGALGFAGQPGVRRMAVIAASASGKRHEKVKDEPDSIRLNDVKASFYMLTGVMLFAESLVLALLFSSVA